MSTRRFAVLAVLVLLLLAAGWTALWYHAAGIARVRFQDWADAKRAAGTTLVYDDVAITGFPFAIHLHLGHPQLAEPPRYAWRADALTVTFEPWHWHSLRLDSPGQHVLTLDDGRRMLRVAAPSATGTLRFADGWRAGALETTFRTVEIDPGGGLAAITAGRLALDAYVPRGESGHEPTIVFVLSADNLTAPVPEAVALAPSIAKIGLDIDVWGHPYGSPLKDALEAWRERGGKIDLKTILLHWGPLSVDGDGTLALDRDLQPEAALSVRVSGYGESLDRLVGAGLVRPAVAAATLTVLSLIANSPSGGGPAEARLPITIQDRHLYVGPVNFFEVPPIRWE